LADFGEDFGVHWDVIAEQSDTALHPFAQAVKRLMTSIVAEVRV